MASVPVDDWIWLGETYHAKYLYNGYISPDRTKIMVAKDPRMYAISTTYIFDIPELPPCRQSKCALKDSVKDCRNCWSFFARCHEFIKAKIEEIEVVEEL